MSKPTSVEEDLKKSISYQERFGSTEYIFSSYKKLSLASIFDCIVVLDTNVLLIPYTLRSEDVVEIEKVYESLSKRDQLLLPEHVAREFAANKDKKLSELYKTVCDRNISILKIPEAAILKGTNEFKELEQQREQLESVAKSYNFSVKKLANKIKDWSSNDPVVQMYSKYFNGTTIVGHDKDDEYITRELERRNTHKIAPGFKDSGKEANSAGDLIVWLTILCIGEKYKKDLIFVSEDRKPDWWNQSNGSAFSPKFELLTEYKKASSGKEINLLIFSEFLEAFNVSENIIEDVKKSEEEFRTIKLKSNKLIHRQENRLKILKEIELEGRNVTRCQLCGLQSTEDNNVLNLHYITPINHGGSEDISNVLILCPNCNLLMHR